MSDGDLARITARTELILKAAGEGIIGLDAHGVQTFVNPAGARLLGYEPEELVGRPSHPIWHHTRRDGTPFPAEDCPVYSAFHDGCVHRGSDEVFWRKDGTSILVEYISTPIVEEGALAGAVVVFRDISKETRLESIAEAVETMNNIGYVFSAVRHELGNPVNSLKMALSVLRKNLDRLTHETIQGYLDRSLAELTRMEDLLASLKSFSLYEQVKVQLVPVDIFLEQFVGVVAADFRERGIRLDLHAAADGVFVHADTRALRQVLLNCLTNAADALEGRPEPAIRLQTICRSKLLEIGIEDNGRGIPAGDLRNLFKPFYTTKPSGTGLGLVIARKMLARMEGTIELKSREGVGTSVTLTLRRENGAS